MIPQGPEEGPDRKVWIVGLHIDRTDAGTIWEFFGVFDNELAAVAACKSDSHFVAPAVMNRTLPDETIDWPGCYYPRLEEKNVKD